ncbi:hypothetical protein [Geodermatophilus obscurus]|uniref:Uncharacterized protein n=1 Tax=Geodermatophilus obscurus (strain ATCC 25078 / DSM 43160 / JCM 3152 / CCUG 61914 / KCC A-0152 / KCTC 9177 / NBRC 13315 / NRRL B-3577 / G-20) TaxID=526225 RepID=D2SBQ7_GEOOG|nr:hypothetical protein [Geodermatophilus obscurus]ADB76164.1 hypothetical protein Gobs_3576 [Geodermatophilus obscurus DSM 43160]
MSPEDEPITPEDITRGELDAISAELRGARRELDAALVVASFYVRSHAESCPAASALTDRIAAAYDRLALANIAATTAVDGHG